MLDSEIIERLAAKERYIQELERQIATVLNENRLLKSALDALRNH